LIRLKKKKICIWNASFDIPFLISRCLKELKPKFLLSLELDDVSTFLGVEKNIRITGKHIQKFYEEFLSGNKEMKEEIINHCRDDLISLSKIYAKVKDLVEVWERKQKNFLF
jgi:uncharacterized protein YprB with RNaseH-like and TPR domain